MTIKIKMHPRPAKRHQSTVQDATADVWVRERGEHDTPGVHLRLYPSDGGLQLVIIPADQLDPLVEAVLAVKGAGSSTSNIKRAFTAQPVDHTGDGTLTDGSVLWEVVTPDGERIGDCSTQSAATELEVALNATLTTWVCADEGDRTANLAQ